MSGFKSARAEGEEEGDLRSDPFLKMEMFLGRPPLHLPPIARRARGEPSLANFHRVSARMTVLADEGGQRCIRRSYPLHSTGNIILCLPDYI